MKRTFRLIIGQTRPQTQNGRTARIAAAKPRRKVQFEEQMRHWIFSNKPANYYGGARWDTATIIKTKRWYFRRDNPNALTVKKGDQVIARIYGSEYFARFTAGTPFNPDPSDDGIGFIEMANVTYFEPAVPQVLIIKQLSNRNVRNKIIGIDEQDFELIINTQSQLASKRIPAASGSKLEKTQPPLDGTVTGRESTSRTSKGSIRGLTSRGAVLLAIAECDRLGADQFLAKYGFGHAKTYHLLHEGHYYDSKAIVGVAHGIEHGLPLRAADFSGGLLTVVPKLKDLGFQVVADRVKDTVALPEEAEASEFWEGSKQSVIINRYERNTAAREACIQHFGTSCVICGFDFAATYGEQFMGFIHVHHIVPLAARNSDYKVDPKTDLRPVCPNCHAVIHYGGATRSIEESRKLVHAATKQDQPT